MLSPPATPSMSQDSTVFGLDSSLTLDNAKQFRSRLTERVKAASTSQEILIILVAFRILNAFSIKTFFQPDEFFQSLEPAWRIAFGANSGAWITWEWDNQLRSAIHPILFAIVYWVASGLAWLLYLPLPLRADLLVAAPKVAQAICAALGDFYTWKLGERVFGLGSNEAWTMLLLAIVNPWQWFCSTRTLSNCLETTLTIAALNYWPWEWSLDRSQDLDDEESGNEEQAEDHTSTSDDQRDEEFVHVGEGSPQISETSTMGTTNGNPLQSTILESSMVLFDALTPVRLCLSLAALACILRPTNVLIWICLTCLMILRRTTYGYFMETRFLDSPLWVHITTLELLPATAEQRKTLIRECLVCGSAVLAFATVIDTIYYRQLTFPPLRFLYFNLAQSLAVFYGKNRHEYYLTEGLPLLLTTYLPFGVIGIYHALSPPRNEPTFINASFFSRAVRYQIATTCLVVPLILSLISHKEVRFIYPLLPLLHLLIATPFTTFFLPAISPAIPRRPLHALKRTLLVLLLVINVGIALLSTTSHQTAPINVMTFLRQQHAKHYLSQPPRGSIAPAPSTMTVGFLMPCHSTPWRSHLVYPAIKAWALGCEPPINFNGTARAAYVDEADRFYASPKSFLKSTLGQPPLPRRKAQSRWWPLGWFQRKRLKKGFGREDLIEADAWDGKPGRKTWPEYLAFFEEKEDLLKDVATGSAYRECWRGWNSWGHDDWRRRGDMIVWCLRSQKERNQGWSRAWL